MAATPSTPRPRDAPMTLPTLTDERRDLSDGRPVKGPNHKRKEGRC
jgi:hypothetical protein